MMRCEIIPSAGWCSGSSWQVPGMNLGQIIGYLDGGFHCSIQSLQANTEIGNDPVLTNFFSQFFIIFLLYLTLNNVRINLSIITYSQ